MPMGYYPELMWNYSPVIRPMPPLALADVCGENPICVSFATEFVPYLLGLLEIYRWPDRFQGTEAEREYSAGLFRELMEVLAMACCCDGTSSITQVVLHQINPITLQLEISVDGGTTWTPDPASPINMLTALPPPVPAGMSGSKCDAATNGKQHIEDLIAGCHEWLTTAVTVFDLAVGVMTTLLELAIAYFSGLTLAAAAAALAGSIWGAAHAAFTYGVSAFDANWTSDEKDKILCALFCHIGDDGSFTDSQYNDFLADWKGRAAINPAFWLVYNSVTAGGRVALNNMCSYGESADADCSDCECGCPLSTWTVENGIEDVPLRTDSSITIDAVPSGSEYIIVVKSPATGIDCCKIGFQLLSGAAPTARGAINCDLAQEAGNIGYSYTGTAPVNYHILVAPAAFRAKVMGT